MTHTILPVLPSQCLLSDLRIRALKASSLRRSRSNRISFLSMRFRTPAHSQDSNPCIFCRLHTPVGGYPPDRLEM